MALYLHKFSTVVQILLFFLCYLGKCTLNLMLLNIKILKIYAETASFNDAIWDEFSDQH
jgi:hypothetical protein